MRRTLAALYLNRHKKIFAHRFLLESTAKIAFSFDKNKHEQAVAKI